tara:strand:- start:1129 stop:1656 length:528 start_codon:yes stop_codon:yes gene_type:complete
MFTAQITPDCNYINIVAADYTNGVSLTGSVEVSTYSQTNIQIITQSITFPSAGATSSILIPTANLIPGDGVLEIKLFQGTSTTPKDETAVLVACNIDCCLANLTQELIDCSCDCPKCATSLAKAQKIFLLLKSSQTALQQISEDTAVNYAAHLQDADEKYKKAKELCGARCGCDC